MKLSELQNQVDLWIKQYGVRYFEPLTNLGILMEEVGELSRVMVREYGEQSKKESDLNKKLADEIADVLWILTAISNQCNIDLTKAMQENFDKKNERDRLRHIQNNKLK